MFYNMIHQIWACASRACSQEAILEQGNIDANAVLASIVTGLDKDSGVHASSIHFNNMLKALGLLYKEVNSSKACIGLLNDQVHKLQECCHGYAKELAGIEDSEKLQLRQEELVCCTSITEIQKLIEDLMHEIAIECQVLDSLVCRHKAKAEVIDSLDQQGMMGNRDDNATSRASSSAATFRKRHDQAIVVRGPNIRRRLIGQYDDTVVGKEYEDNRNSMSRSSNTSNESNNRSNRIRNLSVYLCLSWLNLLLLQRLRLEHRVLYS